MFQEDFWVARALGNFPDGEEQVMASANYGQQWEGVRHGLDGANGGVETLPVITRVVFSPFVHG